MHLTILFVFTLTLVLPLLVGLLTGGCVVLLLKVRAEIPNSWVEEKVWRSDLYLSSGILGFGVLCVLALTSLPSVGNTLNWREFTFVQVRTKPYYINHLYTNSLCVT